MIFEGRLKSHPCVPGFTYIEGRRPGNESARVVGTDLDKPAGTLRRDNSLATGRRYSRRNDAQDLDLLFDFFRSRSVAHRLIAALSQSLAVGLGQAEKEEGRVLEEFRHGLDYAASDLSGARKVQM